MRSKIHVGQLYIYNDKEQPARIVKITEIEEFRVRYINKESGRRVWINKNRFGTKRIGCFSLYLDNH